MSNAPDLQRIRRMIDRADSRIYALFARRVRLAVRAGRVKAAAGLPVRDEERERAILGGARQYAITHGIDPVAFTYAIDAVLELCHWAQVAEAERGAGDSL